MSRILRFDKWKYIQIQNSKSVLAILIISIISESGEPNENKKTVRFEFNQSVLYGNSVVLRISILS